MRKVIAGAALVLALAAAGRAGDAGKLNGAWKGGDPKKVEMTWVFGDRTVEIAVARPGEKGLTESEYKLQADGKQRSIVLDAKAVSGLGLPGVVHYRLEGDTLTLTIPSGDDKGEH